VADLVAEEGVGGVLVRREIFLPLVLDKTIIYIYNSSVCSFEYIIMSKKLLCTWSISILRVRIYFIPVCGRQRK
jgi:hypothetical protein